MATPLPYSQAVDIGGGRGRLAAAAAASLRRVDSQIGHYLDINEAWRSPEQADANYAAYLAYRAYQNGTGGYAPWAPIALPANASIHCIGYAIDTDEQIVRVLNDHGWSQTVYRGGQLVEPWHFEYVYSNDNHRFEAASGGSKPFEEDDMPSVIEILEGQFQLPNGKWVSVKDALGAVYFYGDKLNGDLTGLPDAVWAHTLEHTVAKGVDGSPVRVAAGDILRYEPAEHDGTRRAVALVSADDIDYERVVEELKKAGLDPQAFAVYAADEADRRERERLNEGI